MLSAADRPTTARQAAIGTGKANTARTKTTAAAWPATASQRRRTSVSRRRLRLEKSMALAVRAISAGIVRAGSGFANLRPRSYSMSRPPLPQPELQTMDVETDSPAIVVEGLTKNYKKVVAVDGIAFAPRPGPI